MPWPATGSRSSAPISLRQRCQLPRASGGRLHDDKATPRTETGRNAGWSYVGLYLSTDNVIDNRTRARLLLHCRHDSRKRHHHVPEHRDRAFYRIAGHLLHKEAIADYANNVAESDETDNAHETRSPWSVGPHRQFREAARRSFRVNGSVVVIVSGRRLG